MPPLKNDTFLRALLRQPVEYTPIWMMRQAGRYLPEYRETRARAGGFMDLCKNTELATEVTLQPIDRYNLDAAILFSDILTVPDAMGLGLYFEAGEGPKFQKPVQTEADVAALRVPDMDDLRYVFDAVSSIRKALDGRVPLIGFSGSPFTLACYMVEGGGSKEFRTIKAMMYSRPDLLHKILSVNAQTVTRYLNTQIEQGAQAVQIFDTWGGVLSHAAFQEFSLAYIKQIIGGLIREHDGRRVPVIVFAKGGGQWLELMAECGADALGLDWTASLTRARRELERALALPPGAPAAARPVALQGNLDPNVLFAPPEVIRQQARAVLDAFGPPDAGQGQGRGVGHIFNLGHGISQHTPPEHVAHLVDEVHAYSRRLRQP